MDEKAPTMCNNQSTIKYILGLHHSFDKYTKLYFKFSMQCFHVKTNARCKRCTNSDKAHYKTCKKIEYLHISISTDFVKAKGK